MQNFVRFATAGVLAACALGAQAAGYDFNNYPASNVTAQSAVSRSQVLNDLQVARTQGQLNHESAVYEMPKTQSATVLTRQQVREQTAAAERAGELNYGG